MNKNTICALLLGTSLGCNDPRATKPDGREVLYIPAECKDILTLTKDSAHWGLICKDEKGKEFFYDRTNNDNNWKKYEILRQ